MRSDFRILQERIDELAGVRRRGANIGRAAVRLEDCAELLRFPNEMNAETVTGSVTVGDFNAMLKDVNDIHRTLRAMAGKLRARRGA